MRISDFMDASILSAAPAVRAVIFDMDGVLCDSTTAPSTR